MSHHIPQQYMRQLRSEDFALLAQENQHYQELTETLRTRASAYEDKVQEMERRVRTLTNEKEEYRVRWEEASRRLHSNSQLTNQLQQDYSALVIALHQHSQPTHAQNRPSQPKQSSLVDTLQQRLDELTQHNSLLEQELQMKDLEHEQMQRLNQQLQAQLLHSKVTQFSYFLQQPSSKKEPKRAQIKENREKRSNSFAHSPKCSKPPRPIGRQPKALMI